MHELAGKYYPSLKEYEAALARREAAWMRTVKAQAPKKAARSPAQIAATQRLIALNAAKRQGQPPMPPPAQSPMSSRYSSAYSDTPLSSLSALYSHASGPGFGGRRWRYAMSYAVRPTKAA